MAGSFGSSRSSMSYMTALGSPTERPPMARPVQVPSSRMRRRPSVRSSRWVPPCRMGHNVWLHDATTLRCTSSPGELLRRRDVASYDAFSSSCRLPHRSSHRMVRSRSEEHTSELQSRLHLVCRLLLEKKKRESRYPTLHAA